MANRFGLVLRRPVLSAVTVLAVAGGAFAHEGATGIVKERMDAMERIATAMKRVGAMMNGKTDYEAGEVVRAAETIHRHGGENLTRLFPKDSLQRPTRARPDIWRDWQKFKSLADQVALYSDVLKDAAENGPVGSRQGMQSGVQPDKQSGGGQMMGQEPTDDPEQLRQMPARASFMRLARTCKACHTAFRTRK